MYNPSVIFFYYIYRSITDDYVGYSGKYKKNEATTESELQCKTYAQTYLCFTNLKLSNDKKSIMHI